MVDVSCQISKKKRKKIKIWDRFFPSSDDLFLDFGHLFVVLLKDVLVVRRVVERLPAMEGAALDVCALVLLDLLDRLALRRPDYA